MNALAGLAERLDVHGSREAWLEARRAGVGASDVPALFALDFPEDDERPGIRVQRGPLAIYSAKVAGEPDRETLAMAFGRRFEAPLCEWFAEETGRTVTDPGHWAMLWHPTAPLFATLDRVQRDESRPDPDGVLEAKLTWPSKAYEWRDGPPLAPLLQLQAQLAVTGFAFGTLAVLVGGMSPRYFDVPRHDGLIAGILARVEAFWRMVERREPPPADSKDETAEALARLFPGRKPPEACALSGAKWISAAERLDDHRANADFHSEQATLVSNQIRRAMGDAEIAYLDDGTRLKWLRKAKGGSVTRLKRLGRWKGRAK